MPVLNGIDMTECSTVATLPSASTTVTWFEPGGGGIGPAAAYRSLGLAGRPSSAAKRSSAYSLEIARSTSGSVPSNRPPTASAYTRPTICIILSVVSPDSNAGPIAWRSSSSTMFMISTSA